MNQLFSIYDEKTLVFGQPFQAKTQGEALRMFAAAVNQPDSLLNDYPNDFTLYQIGSFNSENGLLTSECPLVNITRGSNVLLPSKAE